MEQRHWADLRPSLSLVAPTWLTDERSPTMTTVNLGLQLIFKVNL